MLDNFLLFIMQVLISSLEQKVEEVEKKYVESQKLSEEWFREAKEAESEIEKLKNTLQRFKMFFNVKMLSFLLKNYVFGCSHVFILCFSNWKFLNHKQV